MKATPLATAALLALTACTPSPERPLVPWTSPYGFKLPDKPVYVGKDDSICYVRQSPEQNALLRRALAEAAVLEADIESGISASRQTRHIRLTRAGTEGLAARLDRLAEEPQWLNLWLYRHFYSTPAFTIRMRLLDAEGKLLWGGWPTHVSYQPRRGEQPVSLYSELEAWLPVR